jgi:hypothetical protein
MAYFLQLQLVTHFQSAHWADGTKTQALDNVLNGKIATHLYEVCHRRFIAERLEDGNFISVTEFAIEDAQLLLIYVVYIYWVGDIIRRR